MRSCLTTVAFNLLFVLCHACSQLAMPPKRDSSVGMHLDDDGAKTELGILLGLSCTQQEDMPGLQNLQTNGNKTVMHGPQASSIIRHRFIFSRGSALCGGFGGQLAAGKQFADPLGGTTSGDLFNIDMHGLFELLEPHQCLLTDLDRHMPSITSSMAAQVVVRDFRCLIAPTTMNWRGDASGATPADNCHVSPNFGMAKSD